ncbi:hypothetical protein [Halorussus sp. MSC15.2]|uniref:hypothetical protein n=1 Tax=Halorussus sp. MSC15.2 TaxID=2283638 RepID=UPI0013D8DF46|nr:hypothetical protein [Halorussus sp. MSC15.2]NEU58706.1 hypothetical protein [Halorussus sp. MSC15.2]
MTALPSEPTTGEILAKGIELVGGLLLLTAGYYGLLARRTPDRDRRKEYRRTVLQLTTGFLMFAYAAAVLVPETSVWPAQFGDSLRNYFQELDTVPVAVNNELTAFYTALMEKVGVVTGPETSQRDPVAYFLEPVRTLGLVVYTLGFSAASLGLRVPHRLVAGIRGGTEDE